MKAETKKIANLVRQEVCYTLPLFQRKYVWTKTEWEKLWEDIIVLYNNPSANDHFIGSVVGVQLTTNMGAAPTYMLIDGQQRLTTIFTILTCLRDKTNNNQIHSWLVNEYGKNTAYYKLLPTEKENDQSVFCKLIDKFQKQVTFTTQEEENNIFKAYSFFKKQLEKFSDEVSLSALRNIIIERLCLVSITLEPSENPSLVFESLNSTGRKLYPSDLIRNYFFMLVPAEKQTTIYNEYWSKIEEGLEDEELTKFIHHYLQKEGTIVKMSNIYIDLKAKVADNPIEIMKDLLVFSQYYKCFINPLREANLEIRPFLERLKILDNTTAYPFLLNCFHATQQKTISEKNLIEILSVLETLLLRRFFCGEPSNALTKYFPILYQQAQNSKGISFSEAVKKLLAEKYLPTDLEFKEALTKREMYKAAHNSKTTLLLAGIDQSLGKKDKIDYRECTIEHIMPQKLSEWWKTHLGSDCEDTHKTLVHNLGNLTLTSDNSELSNKSFTNKKEQLKENSRVLLNKYFEDKTAWRAADIQKRAEDLANKCLKIWSLFAETPEKTVLDVTGTSPTKLTIKGEVIWAEKQTWKEVLVSVVEYIHKNYSEKLAALMQKYPNSISQNVLKPNGKSFQRVVELKKNLFIEANYSAKEVCAVCKDFLEFVGIAETEWKVDKVLK